MLRNQALQYRHRTQATTLPLRVLPSSSRYHLSADPGRADGQTVCLLEWLECCQLFAELFGQCRRKIRPLRKKIRSPKFSLFAFLKELGLKKNTIFISVSGKIAIFLGHFLRIRDDKRRITIFFKFGPFRSKSAKIWPQNFPLFIRPLWLMPPNNRPVQRYTAGRG